MTKRADQHPWLTQKGQVRAVFCTLPLPVQRSTRGAPRASKGASKIERGFPAARNSAAYRLKLRRRRHHEMMYVQSSLPLFRQGASLSCAVLAPGSKHPARPAISPWSKSQG